MSLRSDELSIETPELVSIDLPLAGSGSRFVAQAVDHLIWFAALILLFLLFLVFRPAIRAYSNVSGQWATAITIFVLFLLNWGYFTLFEAFNNGQTPGKRVARIRVIQRSGRGIGLFESMARNLVRYVDQIPFFYAVGVIVVFSTRQHQRLGDLAAGTLVVRERDELAPAWGESGARTFTASSIAPSHSMMEPHMALTLPANGVAKLTADDLGVLEGFLSRRLDMSMATREQIAQRIASAVQAKSGLEQPEGASIETFLEATARQLRDLSRIG